jgi:hypothetical protein
MGLPPRLDGIGQHDGGSSGHHGMMNAAEDFRVHPYGIRAEDLVQALLVHFANRFVSSRFGLVRVVWRSRLWRAIGPKLEEFSIKRWYCGG